MDSDLNLSEQWILLATSSIVKGIATQLTGIHKGNNTTKVENKHNSISVDIKYLLAVSKSTGQVVDINLRCSPYLQAIIDYIVNCLACCCAYMAVVLMHADGLRIIMGCRHGTGFYF